MEPLLTPMVGDHRSPKFWHDMIAQSDWRKVIGRFLQHAEYDDTPFPLTSAPGAMFPWRCSRMHPQALDFNDRLSFSPRFLCLFVCLFVCSFICSFVHLFICSFVHLYICLRSRVRYWSHSLCSHPGPSCAVIPPHTSHSRLCSRLLLPASTFFRS